MARTWTDREIEFVCDHFNIDLSLGEIARRLRRSYTSVKAWCKVHGLRTRRHYTEQEREQVRRMHATHTASEIALRVFGDASKTSAVWHMAGRLGLRKWPRWPQKIIGRVRRLHGLGLTDAAIARQMGLSRDQVHAIRYERLKLPPNEAAILEARRRGVKTQYARLGIRTAGELRQWAFRQYARRHGWPEDLRPRAVQMLEVLRQRGPQTRRQLAEALGMPWKGSRKSLVSNDPEGSYLAHLQRRGLVIQLGRVYTNGYRYHVVYSLSLTAQRSQA